MSKTAKVWKLPIRTRPGNGWWKDVDNKSKTHCDYCGEKLWINPGGNVYCNNWEHDHDQPGRYETLKEERRGNVTVMLTRDNIEGVYRLEWIRATSDRLSNDGAVGETTFNTHEEAEANYDAEFIKRALQNKQEK